MIYFSLAPKTYSRFHFLLLRVLGTHFFLLSSFLADVPGHIGPTSSAQVTQKVREPSRFITGNDNNSDI